MTSNIIDWDLFPSSLGQVYYPLTNKVWYKFANKQSAVVPNRARLSHLTSVAQAASSEVIDYFVVKFLLSDIWMNDYGSRHMSSLSSTF